jgi:cytosine/adenosine deaminase-related metal-dependent hydrolase
MLSVEGGVHMTLTLTNARVLTMDKDLTEYAKGWVQIDGDIIAALGEGTPPGGGEAVDMGGDLVMPGMVNSHCHMTMTLFRGLGEDVDDRLFRYVLPLERECITPRTVAIGSRLAALEMIRAGVTTVADMYYFETAVGRVIDESGMRGVVGQTLADFCAPDHKSFDEAFALTEEMADSFAGHPRVTASIAPHAPYSTDIPVMARVAEWSAAHPHVPVQLHMAEMASENEWAEKIHGLRPVQVVDRAGLLKPGLIAAHCLFVNDEDMDRMAEQDVRVAHNARSNAKAGRGIAPIEAMRSRGIPVGIATDGPMSGNTLDLFSQLAPVSMFQKLLGQSRKPMPACEVIRMATIEAARVLGMDAKIGSLEPGKQADLIRIALNDPRVLPVYDIYATLVFAAMPSDVRDVMAAGCWLMRDREVVSLEAPKVIADALQAAGEFNARIAEIDRTKR